MSKGTSGGLPWSGWPWDRARAVQRPRRMANRTASRSSRNQLLIGACLGLAIACAGPQGAYERARAAYQHGDIVAALQQAKAGTARWHDPESPWHWNFSLLEAESLTALARLPEADAILNCEPPRRPELSQQR